MYNAEMPSKGYDRADLAALRQSNIIPVLVSNKQLRFDSAMDASVFFARELDYIKSKSYDKVYPELTALNGAFPITHEVPEGAETFTYYSYEKTGVADIIGNYADDLPRADVKGTPTTGYVKSIGDSYGYSVQEMRASRMAGKSLDQRKAEAARYSIDRKTNTLVFRGDDKNNLVGIFSANNNIPVYTVAQTSGGKTEWKDKSAAEILADVNGMVQAMSTLTQAVETADTLLLPPAMYIDISTRQIPNTGYTIKRFLLENSPFLKNIEQAPELAASNTETNPSGKNAMLLYKNDPEKFSVEIPMPFLQYPLQNRNLEIVIPCEQRVAGVVLYYPLALMLAYGI